MEETADIPDRAGFMILPGVTLFPHSLLPLHIFEERYRAMLREALDGNRMFGIAHTDGEGRLAPVGGIGIVRACVANEDGTSNLILQGLSRVLINDLAMQPFPQAEIAELPDVNGDDSALQGLRNDVSELLQQIRLSGAEMPRGFDQYIANIGSHGAFADAISAAFITDPVERRGLLEECDVAVRMRRLLGCLLTEVIVRTGKQPGE